MLTLIRLDIYCLCEASINTAFEIPMKYWPNNEILIEKTNNIVVVLSKQSMSAILLKLNAKKIT